MYTIARRKGNKFKSINIFIVLLETLGGKTPFVRAKGNMKVDWLQGAASAPILP